MPEMNIEFTSADLCSGGMLLLLACDFFSCGASWQSTWLRLCSGMGRPLLLLCDYSGVADFHARKEEGVNLTCAMT